MSIPNLITRGIGPQSDIAELITAGLTPNNDPPPPDPTVEPSGRRGNTILTIIGVG